MPRASRSGLRLLGISLALLGSAAGPAARARAQAPADPEAPFSERVDVEVVSVDVIVTDPKQGRVMDLGRDDFEVLVDGHAVPIDYFAAPRLALASATKPAALAAESLPELSVPPRPAPAPLAPANLIFYIDQTALENRARHETVSELREFLAARPAGGDRVMVAAFEQDLRVLLQPTTDPVRIARALDELESRPSLAKLTSSERTQLYQDIRAYGRNAMRLSGASAAERGARLQQSEIIRLDNEITLWA